VLSLTQHDQIIVLQADDGENRFNRTSIDRWHTALDQVEHTDGPLVLITTGTGKFYSNGLDLDWLMGDGAGDSAFLPDVHRLLLRILDFPAVTIAAVNGHAFAGGAMLATAHDIVIMREDRGYWCLPEVDLGLPLTPVMFEVVQAHLPPATLRDAMLTGRRFGGPEALQAGIAHALAPVDEVLNLAFTRAKELVTKDRDVVIAHKRMLRPLGSRD
jgi:enoyl-CoA hydratase/carnithine racemase